MTMAEDILVYEGYKHRVEALERWVKLLALSTRSERAELRLAGVAEHTIEALYPREFSDLISSLEALFEQPRPKGRLDASFWSMHDDKQRTLENLLQRRVDVQMDADFGAFLDTGAFSHLESLLGKRLSDPLREVKANAMITNLWSVHWFMTHLDQIQPELHEQIYIHFTDTIDWVLPHLSIAPATIEP